MSRTITHSLPGGVRLVDTTDNPVTIASGVVLGPNTRDALYGIGITPWSITNLGTLAARTFGITLASGGSVDNEGLISASQTFVTPNGDFPITHVSGTAIAFGANGTVVNGGQNAGASIVGGKYGVSVAGIGSVANAGLISGTGYYNNYHDERFTTGLVAGFNGVGVLFGLGGSVVNAISGKIVGGAAGVSIAGSAGSVANDGTIEARYSTSGPSYDYNGGTGISLAAGGTVTNTGLILGASHGVAVSGGGGTVLNQGQITSYGYGFYGWAVSFASGGTVVNTGSIYGGNAGVLVAGGTGVVLNTGSIGASSYKSDYGVVTSGVNLEAGGTVLNSGEITGDAYGVRVGSGAGRVINTGTLASSDFFRYPGGGFVGVALNGGGVVDNGVGGPGGADTRTALIYGNHVGVTITGGPGTVANAGTVKADTGIVFGTGVGSATVVNRGLIDGLNGTAIDFGTAAATLRIAAGSTIIGQVVADPTHDNTLRLVGSAPGTLAGLGSAIVGFDQLFVGSGQWSLAGVDTASSLFVRVTEGAGLTVTGGLTVAHSLSLGSNDNDIFTHGVLAVAGSGSVTVGTATGAAGALTVGAATSSAAAGTVLLGGTIVAASIRDDGRITALPQLAALQANVTGAGVLALDPGAVLDVSGALGVASVTFVGAGDSTLQLERPGAATSTFSGFAAGDTIDLLGTVSTGISYASATDVLTVKAGGATVAALHFAGTYSASFKFAGDGHGGTNIFLG